MMRISRSDIMMGICICLLIFTIVDNGSRPAVDKLALQQIIDSLAVHDRNRGKEINILRIKYSQDSFALSGIRQYIISVPKKKQEIIHTYNDKRNHIDTLPPDEQVRIFSEWISSEEDN